MPGRRSITVVHPSAAGVVGQSVSASVSAIAATVTFVFARGMVGITEASATTRLSRPRTRPDASTTCLYPKDVEGRLIAIVVMLVGIGFLSVLTATFAARFVRTDTGSDEVLETLRRIEADIAELKTRLL